MWFEKALFFFKSNSKNIFSGIVSLFFLQKCAFKVKWKKEKYHQKSFILQNYFS